MCRPTRPRLGLGRAGVMLGRSAWPTGADFKKKLKFQKQFILNSKKVEEKIWNSKKKSYEVPKFQIVREKMGILKNFILNSKKMEAAGRAKKVGRKP